MIFLKTSESVPFHVIAVENVKRTQETTNDEEQAKRIACLRYSEVSLEQ